MFFVMSLIVLLNFQYFNENNIAFDPEYVFFDISVSYCVVVINILLLCLFAFVLL